MPQINKKNFSTTADNADIFTITQGGAKFTNLGNLTTSGDLSSPIHVAADGVTVANLGSLTTSGDGSPGVAIGDPFGLNYDNVTVVNYGSITTTGEVFDDGITFGISGGIEIFGGDHATAINFGTISAIEGIGLAASNSTVLNYGTIESLGAGLYVSGIEDRSTGNTAVNYGMIHGGSDFGFSYGIAFFSDGGVAKNYGTIQVDGFHDFGMAIEGFDSRGENYGTIIATGEQGRGVLLNLYGNDFINHGTIETTGLDSIGVRWAVGEVDQNSDGGTFTNFGTVRGDVFAVLGNEQCNVVVNRGVLNGIVDLAEAADTYVAGRGGSLHGELILGDGNDLVVCERGCGQLTIGDFLVGAGSDDVLDLRAFGFDSLDDVLAHAFQDGSNVLLNLGDHDQVVLEGVSLASLSEDDFNFGNVFGAFSPGFDHGAAAVPHLDAPAIF